MNVPRERYGRFPAYAPPFRTVLGFQANHVDVEFYDRFYRPAALAATQREHLARWHGGAPETREVNRPIRRLLALLERAQRWSRPSAGVEGCELNGWRR